MTVFSSIINTFSRPSSREMAELYTKLCRRDDNLSEFSTASIKEAYNRTLAVRDPLNWVNERLLDELYRREN